MAGLVYDVGRYLYQVRHSAYKNTSSRHHVDSERYIVHDKFGNTEHFEPDILWANPDTYIWVSYAMIEHTMYYFFEFSG